MARLTGLEPATPGVTGRYSNRLSYNRAILPGCFRACGFLPAAVGRVKRGSRARHGTSRTSRARRTARVAAAQAEAAARALWAEKASASR